jgi:hypothetical protein
MSLLLAHWALPIIAEFSYLSDIAQLSVCCTCMRSELYGKDTDWYAFRRRRALLSPVL